MLASASSLLGGLLRIGLLFLLMFSASVLKLVQCTKSVDSLEDVSLNGALLFFFFNTIFYIFYKGQRGLLAHLCFRRHFSFFIFWGVGLFLFFWGPLQKSGQPLF